MYAINQQMDTYINTRTHRQVMPIGMLITGQIIEVIYSSDKEREMREQPIELKLERMPQEFCSMKRQTMSLEERL